MTRLTCSEFIAIGKYHGTETNGIVHASLFPKKLLPLIDNNVKSIYEIANSLGIEILKHNEIGKTHLILDFSKCKDIMCRKIISMQ